MSESDLKVKQEMMDFQVVESEQQYTNEDDDPVVKEIDVYLAKSSANNIYIIQYPIRPQNRTYENSKYLCARIKPKQNKLEIELDLNTNNENYSKAKGEQFALNVDGKLQPVIPNSKQNQAKSQEQQRYYKSNLMDKQVLTSTNATLGQMNRLYHLGYLNEDKLHLTPVQSILQMKPNFDYFDISEKKVKDLKETNEKEIEYSTEEEIDSEIEKAELVTMKYSSQTSQNQTQLQQQQEQEQNWIQLKFDHVNETSNKITKDLLECKKQDNLIKLDISNEEFIERLMDLNNTNNS